MSKNDGGPAFPVEVRSGSCGGLDLQGKEMKPNTTTFYKGLSLRDYFAIHASDSDIERILIYEFDHALDTYLVTRQQARYMHADAMLTERAK